MVKAVIFTDFDGTVTLQDSNDYLTDKYGFGPEVRRVIFEGVLAGTTDFRDGFTRMIDSVTTPLPESLAILQENIQLDPGFKETYEWAQANGVPVVVVSSGMEPIIRALLTKLLGADAVANIDIVANAVDLDENQKMKVVYRDESGHGHDKSRSIDVYKREFEAKQAPGESRPTYFYCGDGISDLSAAKECDLLFAKRGKDLVTFCKRQNVPFHEFDSFKDILGCMKQVMAGEKTVKELMEN
ncbi:putative phosphoric monoester hydrolase [Maudiozyma humilis]|uniref:Phosphoric monoester hydrolase n=1 Tax=Maudiozyma humilis TaxID=51915 RepID=A0AAV5RZI1_MAUHU|nr:putative phosphoric monoester hydrolase [Kazachstania humilis]